MSTIARIAATILFLALLLPSPMSAHTQPVEGIPIATHALLAGPPVQTDSCTLSTVADTGAIAGTAILGYAASRSRGIIRYLLAGAAGTAATRSAESAVTVRFTNESTHIATMVRFAVRASNGITVYLRDVGTFSPGISITHTFTGIVAPPGFFGSTNLRCRAHDIIFTHHVIWTGGHHE